MRLHRACGADAGIAPDVTEQVLTREYPVRVGSELHEQRVLLLRDVDLAAVREHPARTPVDDELAEIEHFAARRTATQQRADARDELFVHERPREVVVTAFERTNLRLWIRSAEDDHGAVRHAATVELVRVAEHEQIRIGGARELVGAREGEHVEAVTPKLPLEEAAIEVNYAKMAPEAKLMFDWAHLLHRQIYDVLASENMSLNATRSDFPPEAVSTYSATIS